MVYGGKSSTTDRNSEEWKAFYKQMIDDASPFGAAGHHHIHDVIDPAQTRDYIIRALEIARSNRTCGIGEHKLANWPTKF